MFLTLRDNSSCVEILEEGHSTHDGQLGNLAQTLLY